MQDSFDARMHGDAPASVKHKSNIGWIVTIGILLVGLVALVVMQVLAYQEITKKDNEISELKNKPAAMQAEVKEPTGAEIGGDEQGEMSDRLTQIDIAGLKKVAGVSSDGGVYLSINKLEFTNDGKYLYAIGGISASGFGGAGVWYKSTTSDAEWQTIVKGAQAVGDCSNYSKEVLDFMKDYSYIDDDLPSGYLACRQADGSIFPE